MAEEDQELLHLFLVMEKGMASSRDRSEAFFSYLEKMFSVSLKEMEAFINGFHSEMKKGLSGAESSLKMIPCFVDRPTGSERGDFLALDLGGTNLRVLAVTLDGKRSSTISATHKFVIPKEKMQGTGVVLFDYIAHCIDLFLTEYQMDRGKNYDLAFTFSFPVEQMGVASGNLITWTKGFTATGVRGRDVMVLLREALRRNHIQCINLTALANDTVGTLAAGGYVDPACDLGVIMGTGTNACYRERIGRIGRVKSAYDGEYMIVNLEWGNFDGVARTFYDRILDQNSVNPGAMYLEKMVSGMYLGELARIVLLDLIKRDLILVNEPTAGACFTEKRSFTTEDMSRFEGDTGEGLEKIASFFREKGIPKVPFHERKKIKHLCSILSRRAAGLGAAAITAVLSWMDPQLDRGHTVAVDGTLFEKYPGFKAGMRHVFKSLLGDKAEKIALVHTKDGSGKGAAIIAAVAAAVRSPKK